MTSQVAQIKEIFSLFDRDGDGFIPTRDIALAIRATGFNPNDKQMDDLLKGKDDHMFSFDEFSKLVTPNLQGKDIRKTLIEAFAPFDRDRSGQISSGELKHVMLNLSEMREHVDSMIQEADPTGSGTIHYEQLVDILLS